MNDASIKHESVRRKSANPLHQAIFPVLINETRRGNVPSTVVVYVIRDERCSLDHPLGDAIEVLISRKDAERFVDEVR